MISYELAVTIVAGIGFFAAVIFLVLYTGFDRPRYQDRYSGILMGLGILCVIGFGIPFLLALFSADFVGVRAPRPAWQWGLSIFLRGIGSGYMCWILWVYLTPGRARNRLGRYAPNREAKDVAEG